MIEIGEVYLAQEDGGLPIILASGNAPGESGVSVLRLRFRGGAHFAATTRRHLVWFQEAPEVSEVPFDCRIADGVLLHRPAPGSLAICPAGCDSAADTIGRANVDAILVTVDPAQLALAAVEDLAPDTQLVERLSGDDRPLLDLARTLASESVGGYPNGPLFWNEVASSFIGGLVDRHTSRRPGRPRGMLGKDVLDRLREYIVAHLDEPIEVATLAGMAGRSPFHFSRVFARSVGVTPHRYVVHLRLQRAVELVREGRSGLAEVAARTGFADQSHLSRWARRVHGVPLTQLAA